MLLWNVEMNSVGIFYFLDDVSKKIVLIPYY